MTKFESIRNRLLQNPHIKRLIKTKQSIKDLIKETLEEIIGEKGSSEGNTFQRSVIIEHSDIDKPVQIKHQPEKIPFRNDDLEPDHTIYQHELERNLDFSNIDDLEEYADHGSINEKTIEQWIAAGILLPDEIRAAEKLIKRIRGNEKTQSNHVMDFHEKPHIR